MSKKQSWKKRAGVVYSTNPDFQYKTDQEEPVDSPTGQKLKVRIERKGRGGKTVTLITGFSCKEEEIASLGRALKAACGTGGTVKAREIILQGDKRDKAITLLEKKGYRVVRAGG